MPKKKKVAKRAVKKVAVKEAKRRWFLRVSTDPTEIDGDLFVGPDPKHLKGMGCLCSDGVEQVQDIMGSDKDMLPGALIELSCKVVEPGLTDAQRKKPEELMKTATGRQFIRDALDSYDD